LIALYGHRVGYVKVSLKSHPQRDHPFRREGKINPRMKRVVITI
jgi:hypothetical protein